MSRKKEESSWEKPSNGDYKTIIRTRVLLRRKTYIYIAILSIGLVASLFYDYFSYNRKRHKASMESGAASIELIRTRVDSLLQVVMQSTHRFTGKLEVSRFSKEELLAFIEKESMSNDLIQGITVAYEPYRFQDSIKLFSPYYDKRQGSMLEIGSVYDYTDPNNTSAKWYTEVVKRNDPVWSEPYFAKGAQLIVTDYGIPFYDKKGDGDLLGTVSFTLALDDLGRILNEFSIGSTGYAYMASSSGKIISHLNSALVLNVTLQELGKQLNLEQTVEEMLQQRTGSFQYTSMLTNVDSYSFYNTMEANDWKVVVVFATNDLLGQPIRLGNKIVNLGLAASFLVLIWLAVIIRINENTNSKLWLISTVLSVLLVVNIAIIWWLNINMNYAYGSERPSMVITTTSLNKFIGSENTRLRNLGFDPYIPVPTGIYVENMQFNDSYNISIKGKVWQTLPTDFDWEPNFEFVQRSPGTSTTKSLVSVKEIDDGKNKVYLWDFNTRIRIPLKYNKYPFDSRDVNIELAYPDLQSNILLVPDLNGYQVLNPSTFPGVNPDIYFPRATMISSHFSFDRINFKTKFGNPDYKGEDFYPVMVFNINLKRRFINAFVTNIIPIMVVATMIFLIFFSNSRNKDENTGLSMMGVVQSCAGFFFVLLLAHIALRRELATPEITYMETFYFTMYIMIALLAINIVAFTKAKDHAILHYEDNLLVKLAFWPLLLGSWLVISLQYFYH